MARLFSNSPLTFHLTVSEWRCGFMGNHGSPSCWSRAVLWWLESPVVFTCDDVSTHSSHCLKWPIVTSVVITASRNCKTPNWTLRTFRDGWLFLGYVHSFHNVLNPYALLKLQYLNERLQNTMLMTDLWLVKLRHLN